jgi:REP element-mobilizing transposase RayT
LKQRKSPRLKEYDYSIPNYYFVTICVEGKRNIFGELIGDNVELNKNGIIVNECLLEIKEHFTSVDIDEYVIMPNHFHALIILQSHVGLRSPQPINNEKPEINSEREMNDQSKTKTKHFSLSQVIAYFKYQSTKRINEGIETKEKVWQRSFYDRIIRNERELYNIRKYIRQNPLKKHLEIAGDLNL